MGTAAVARGRRRGARGRWRELGAGGGVRSDGVERSGMAEIGRDRATVAVVGVAVVAPQRRGGWHRDGGEVAQHR